jgi:hypothetical protein
MPTSYKYLTREIEKLVREVEQDWFDASEFPEKIDLYRRALLHRAKGFIYSEQLVGGYITEVLRYVTKGRFYPEHRRPMLDALARLHAAADFEPKS